MVASFSEKRSSIIICHITSFKRVLVRYTIYRIGVVFKRRTIKYKHTGICWGQLLCIIRLKNWAMSGLQSGKKFTALFLHSALSKYNWSSNISCGYSIKMLSKYYWLDINISLLEDPVTPSEIQPEIGWYFWWPLLGSLIQTNWTLVTCVLKFYNTWK